MEMTASDSERAILIVDDSETAVAALEVALSSIPGTEIILAASAEAALRNLREGCKRISAVVTDIRMPVMDGFELIQSIRADRKHASIPIVVVTGDTDPETPVRSSRLGANAFFTKPCSPAALRKTLEKLLDGNEKP